MGGIKGKETKKTMSEVVVVVGDEGDSEYAAAVVVDYKQMNSPCKRFQVTVTSHADARPYCA